MSHRVAMALIGPARVSAAERVLWAKHHTYYVWDKNKQGKAWGTASDRMSTACHRGEETRSALGHVRLPGTFLKSVKFIAQHWPTIYRVSGFDDSCAIAQKLFRVQLAIGSFDNFCEVVDSCHLQSPWSSRALSRWSASRLTSAAGRLACQASFPRPQ